MAFLLLLSANVEDPVKTREVSMPEKKDGIVEMVKETGASLGQAITAAVETAADYLTPSKRRPAATKKRTATAPQPSKAAARTQRKKTAAKKTRTAASTKRAMSTQGRKKTVKPRIAGKQKKAA
jgi:hypothetical protein